MASTGVSVNRNTMIVIAILLVGATIFYLLRWRTANSFFELKEVDVTKLPEVPSATAGELSAFTANQVSIYVEVNGKKLSIYSLQTMPKSSPKGTVLLLHGLGDGAHNWVQVNTMSLLAHWGYRAVAVDLPGYGHSTDMALGDLPLEDFMVALVTALGHDLPIIVAPSMGGRFAIPYLFQSPGVGVKRAAGFVAISPTSTETFKHNYPESQLRTLILYGETDVQLGAFSRERLQTLPLSHIITIPNAGHACFKDQPGLFHRALYHYLTYLLK